MFKDSCLFCKIAKKEIPSRIVFEDDEVTAFEDIKPQAPVHIVIIPKMHIERLSDIDIKDGAIMSKLILTAKDMAEKRGVSESGYRVVINCNRDGGQEIFHLHAHLLGGRPLAWPPG
ncbi:MAG: histidine triad nucleotide-binding protein [Candidatus Omnitrophica bacterium]|nr:histidine triad nucleotide-binding protein [Candidatus Omnitrophota bacterium]